jgi:hypothetical protein
VSTQASIDVQFKPFRLTLLRGNDGQWVATLTRIGDDTAIVVAYSSPGRAESAARISLATGTPRLAVGSATFALPTKQLQRVRDWIDQQNAPVVSDGRDESFGRPGPDGFRSLGADLP